MHIFVCARLFFSWNYFLAAYSQKWNDWVTPFLAPVTYCLIFFLKKERNHRDGQERWKGCFGEKEGTGKEGADAGFTRWEQEEREFSFDAFV